jgi:hypothetical protein
MGSMPQGGSAPLTPAKGRKALGTHPACGRGCPSQLHRRSGTKPGIPCHKPISEVQGLGPWQGAQGDSVPLRHHP